MRAARTIRGLLLILAAGLGVGGGVLGCAAHSQLVPAPDAERVTEDAAAATASGVRVVADPDAWRGQPGDLEWVMTPVHVRVENHSGRTLRIRHADFALAGDSGFRFAAISPFTPWGQGLEAATAQQEPWRRTAPRFGWQVGPWGYWGRYSWGPGWGPGWGPWGPYGPGGYGPPWYGPYGPMATAEPLPTRDMLRKALPEGMLEDGGTVSGFLYFPDVRGREQGVSLTADLTDARTGEPVGTVRIPFVARH